MHRTFALIVCSLMPALAFAAGEMNGRIRGTITEADTGLPVPGATVTVSGPALIGGPQTATSAEDGTFLFVELPSGTYDVEIAYAGVKPIKRRLGVRQGETMPLDVAWSAELAEAEVTEIVEERRLTRPDSTHTGTVLSFDQQRKLATQRTYTDVVQQVAGVKGDRGLPVVKGANRLSNRYLIDGMDITDSTTNNFATQLNFDSIGSLEVLTGGMEAQYNSLGGVINVNSNAGSDELKIDTSFYIRPSALSAKNTYGSQLYEHELVFNDAPLGANNQYFATVNVSGPIVKQKLWYGFAVEYQHIQSSIVPGPPITGLQHPSRLEHNLRPRLKLTFAPNSKNRLTWSTSGDPAVVANRAQSNTGLPVTEYGQTQGGFFTVLQWDHFASQYVSTNVQTGFNYNTVAQTPIGQFLGGAFLDFGPRDPRFSDTNYTYEAERPQRRNTSDGSVWYQGDTRIDDRRYTFQLDPSISVRGKAAGEHDAKFGIQTRAVIHTFTSHTPGGATYSDRGGGLLEAGLCDPDTGIGCVGSQVTYRPDFSNRQWGFGIGAFMQDRWKVHKRLTILPGIRIDYGVTKNSSNQVVSSQWGLGPRLGFALDLTGDQKTILTGYYGRANDTLNLLPASRADPVQTTETHRWDPDANEGRGGYAFLNRTGGGDGIRLDPYGAPPHTDEVTAAINREIYKDSVVSLAYTYKKVSNIWSEVETNQIWDPSGQRVVGYVSGNETENRRQIVLYTTPDLAYRIYHGVDLAIESRPTPNWDIYAGYTLSWTFGPGADTVGGTVGGGNAFANPRQTRFFEGFLPEDSRHNLKLRVSYTTHGFSIGANFSYASGSPLTHLFFNAQTGGYSLRRSPQGTTTGGRPNDPDAFAAFRTPDIVQLSLRASYDFHALIKQHLLVIADVFNAFNLDTPTQGGLVASDNANFGQINQYRLNPLQVQLAIRYML